jgi:REP element-mobilizing transposase RayT
MTRDPNIHRRHSPRLRGYDYSQAGMYFVTACTRERVCSFGDIIDGGMYPNDAGKIVWMVWDALPEHYPHIAADIFVVMPNHVHGIVVIEPGFKPAPTDERTPPVVGAGLKPAPTARHGLSEIMRAFKTFSSRRINEMRETPGVKVWQRNFWERVIRNDEELSRIREYIQNNPAQWTLDRLHPQSGWTPPIVGAGLKPIPTDEQIPPAVGAGLKPIPTDEQIPPVVGAGLKPAPTGKRGTV